MMRSGSRTKKMECQSVSGHCFLLRRKLINVSFYNLVKWLTLTSLVQNFWNWKSESIKFTLRSQWWLWYHKAHLNAHSILWWCHRWTQSLYWPSSTKTRQEEKVGQRKGCSESIKMTRTDLQKLCWDSSWQYQHTHSFNINNNSRI